MDENGLKAAMDRKSAEYLADLKGAGRAAACATSK